MFMPVEGRGGGGGRPMCCAGAEATCWRGGGGSWYMARCWAWPCGRCRSCWGSATVCALLRGLEESGSKWPSGTLRLECSVGRAAGGARRLLRSEGAVCERDDWERWRGAIGMSRARGRVRCEGARHSGQHHGRRCAAGESSSSASARCGRRTLSEAVVCQQTDVVCGAFAFAWEAPCSLPVRLVLVWVAEWGRGRG